MQTGDNFEVFGRTDFLIFNHQTVASYLRAELAQRMADQPGYSLRAMAKDLELSPAYLSQILNNKKKLSPSRRLTVAEKLGLAERETQYFYLLVQHEMAPSDTIRQNLDKQLHDLAHSYEDQALDADHFRFISDWYHVPLLEMTFLDNFEFTVENASRLLGITTVQTEAAMERLVRLGLVTENAGIYKKTDQNVVFRTNRRNEAFGSFMRQMFGLAADAMDHHPVHERVMMTQTFCLAASQLEEARQITREYLQRMAGLFETAKTRDKTYQLCVQFFNLTDGRLKESD